MYPKLNRSVAAKVNNFNVATGSRSAARTLPSSKVGPLVQKHEDRVRHQANPTKET